MRFSHHPETDLYFTEKGSKWYLIQHSSPLSRGFGHCRKPALIKSGLCITDHISTKLLCTFTQCRASDTAPKGKSLKLCSCRIHLIKYNSKNLVAKFPARLSEQNLIGCLKNKNGHEASVRKH